MTNGKLTGAPDPAAPLLPWLAHRVRLVEVELLAALRFGGDVRAARRAVRVLERAGLVTADWLLMSAVPTITALTGPTASWQPGAPGINPAEVVKVARSRWRRCGSAQLVQVVLLTEQGARLTGGVVSKLRLSELGHDRLAQRIYFALGCPDDWYKAEAAIEAPEIPGVVPDIWRGSTAVEVIGADYRPLKVKRFAEKLMAHEVSFELW